jgi:hypothetical protein
MDVQKALDKQTKFLCSFTNKKDADKWMKSDWESSVIEIQDD